MYPRAQQGLFARYCLSVRQPRTFLVTVADQLREGLAGAILANRLRAGHSALVAVVPPQDVHDTECVLVPATAEDIDLAARASDGIIIATPQMASQIHADRCLSGDALVLLGHSNPNRAHELTSVAKHRLKLARRWAHEHSHQLRVVILSGRGLGADGVAPEADQYAIRWEGDRLPLIREVASTTTSANADEAVALLEHMDGIDRVIIVTSWWHVKRSIIEMRRAMDAAQMDIPVHALRSWKPLPRMHQLRVERRANKQLLARQR